MSLTNEDGRPWNKTMAILPFNGLVVETKIDDGRGKRNQQSLKRQGSLWFFPDGSMYVYYRPTHWREEIPEKER